MLSWSWAQNPNRSHVMHMGPGHVQQGSTWDPLATASQSWAQHGERMDRHKKAWETPVKGRVLRISDWAGNVLCVKSNVELNLGWSCSQTGPSWGQVAPCLAKWAQVGPKLGPCSPKVAPSGADAADLGQNGELGRCCTNVQHTQMTTAGNLSLAGVGRSWKWAPPSWSCTTEQRIVRINRLCS